MFGISKKNTPIDQKVSLLMSQVQNLQSAISPYRALPCLQLRGIVPLRLVEMCVIRSRYLSYQITDQIEKNSHKIQKN